MRIVKPISAALAGALMLTPPATAQYTTPFQAQPASRAVAGIAAAVELLSIGWSLPMERPMQLSPSYVESFRYAAETIHLGFPLPGAPRRLVVLGGGKAIPAGPIVMLRLSIDRIVADGRDYFGSQPLAEIQAHLDATTRQTLWLSVVTLGGLNVPGAFAQGSPVPLIQHQAITAMLNAIALLPQGPVATGQAVFDINRFAQSYFAQRQSRLRLLRPLAPATVAGYRLHDTREAVVAAVRDTVQFAAGPAAVAVSLQGEFLFDTETSLPLVVRARLFGNPGGRFAEPVDSAFRLYVALPGMADPSVHLSVQPLPAPQAMPAEYYEAYAPAARSAPTPAVAPALRPAAPPAVAPARQAAPVGEVGARLQRLKELYDRGLVTKEQYEAKQKEILGDL